VRPGRRAELGRAPRYRDRYRRGRDRRGPGLLGGALQPRLDLLQHDLLSMPIAGSMPKVRSKLYPHFVSDMPGSKGIEGAGGDWCATTRTLPLVVLHGSILRDRVRSQGARGERPPSTDRPTILYRMRVGVPLHPRSDTGRDSRPAALRSSDGSPVGLMLLPGGQPSPQNQPLQWVRAVADRRRQELVPDEREPRQLPRDQLP
jgi:hypothetical protein